METPDSETVRPSIVAPAFRTFYVSDVARSNEFYRNVFGFTTVSGVRSDEVRMMCGAATVVLVHRDRLLKKDHGDPIIFLETNDVPAMHAMAKAGGANPGSIQQVNWIKTDMFEVRDPDGNILWFGKSFDKPDEPRTSITMEKIMPEFPLNDVPSGIAYYRDALGFSINYQQEDIGVLDRDDIRVLLISRTEKHKGITSAYVYVANADRLYEELKSKGAKIASGPVTQPWGLREFRVADLEGNYITYGQPFE